MGGRVVSDRTDAITLRQWADDAQQVFNNWTGTTYSATKDAQIKELFRRIGIMADHMADFLEHNSFAD